MKRYSTLILLIFLTGLSYAQPYMKVDFLSYFDKLEIDSIMANQAFNQWLIYQTMLNNDSLVSDIDEDRVATFLFWQNRDTVFIKLFTKDVSFITEKSRNTGLFNYKHIDKVGVDDKENNLMFVPPILVPFSSEIVIYHTGKEKFFFEFGSIHLYSEDRKKHKYRKEFIEMVRHEAITNLKRFKVEKEYSRKSLYYEDCP